MNCTHMENGVTCPIDCPPECGDLACNGTENAVSCAEDCNAVCGDSACTHNETFESCGLDCMPNRVDVSIIGAVINLHKSDLTQWDGSGTFSQIAIDAVVTAMTAGTPLSIFDDVLAAIGNAAVATTDKPDPYGFIELAWQGPFDQGLNQLLPMAGGHVSDNYAPDWPGLKPGWINIPYTPNLQIRVTLTDFDLVNDDTIGTVILNADDISEAFFANQIWSVKVNDQNDQILLIRISVTPSAPLCGGDCDAGNYSACTCAAFNVCGWQNDGICDSECETNFPQDFFDDTLDCL